MRMRLLWMIPMRQPQMPQTRLAALVVGPTLVKMRILNIKQWNHLMTRLACCVHKEVWMGCVF